MPRWDTFKLPEVVANSALGGYVPEETSEVPVTPSVTPSNTPTPSITASATVTPTNTPTNTNTPTPSVTIGSTPTMTPSNTATIAATPTHTPTPSSTDFPGCVTITFSALGSACSRVTLCGGNVASRCYSGGQSQSYCIRVVDNVPQYQILSGAFNITFGGAC